MLTAPAPLRDDTYTFGTRRSCNRLQIIPVEVNTDIALTQGLFMGHTPPPPQLNSRVWGGGTLGCNLYDTLVDANWIDKLIRNTGCVRARSHGPPACDLWKRRPPHPVKVRVSVWSTTTTTTTTGCHHSCSWLLTQYPLSSSGPVSDSDAIKMWWSLITFWRHPAAAVHWPFLQEKIGIRHRTQISAEMISEDFFPAFIAVKFS